MTTASFDDTDVAPTNDVAATRPYDELNLSSDAFWEQDVKERDLIFKQLREQRPITWQLHQQMPVFAAGEPTLMKTNFMRGVVSLPLEPNLVRQP